MPVTGPRFGGVFLFVLDRLIPKTYIYHQRIDKHFSRSDTKGDLKVLVHADVTVVDRFHCIEAFGGSSGFYVRATIRGHWAREFPRLMIHDCEYLCDQPDCKHGKRITCFEVDVGGVCVGRSGAAQLREFLQTTERLGIVLPERKAMRNAVPLADVITYLNIIRA